MNTLIIADAGLPIPDTTRRIDLAVAAGIPAMLDVLQAVLDELQIESIIIASELERVSPTMYNEVKKILGDLPIETISHEEFKQQTKQSKAVICTGEFTLYANIILVAGVTFLRRYCIRESEIWGMGKIIVLASINMDVVVMTPRHPRLGETLFGSDVKFIPGGKGSNQAVAASRLADGVALVGKLGQDAFGTALHDFLKGENLDLKFLSFSDTAPSGTALIAVDENSENTIIVVSGSNFEISPRDIEQVTLESGDIVVAPFEVPQESILALFQRAKEVGASTIINPTPATSFIADLQGLCDTIIINETELAFFAGQTTIATDSDSIQKQVQKIQTRDDQTIIVTLGSKGAVCLSGSEYFSVAGRKVEAVDTTGAGDCFVGALSVALAEGQSLHNAIEFANVTASLSVQKIGASASLPYRQTVNDAMNK
jgi:ribokinase